MNSDEITKRGYIGFPEEVDVQVGDWVKGKLTNNVFNRVNNRSTDQSINVVNTSNHDLFDEIKKS